MIDEMSLLHRPVAAQWSSPEIGDLNHNPTRQRGIVVAQKNPSLTFRVVISGLSQNRKLFRDCSQSVSQNHALAV